MKSFNSAATLEPHEGRQTRPTVVAVSPAREIIIARREDPRFSGSLKWFITSHRTSSLLQPVSMSARTRSRVCGPQIPFSMAVLCVDTSDSLFFMGIDEELIKHGLEEDVWYEKHRP